MEDTATGIIFGVQHFSVDDGPGIRTAVFLKGCNMSCEWCHNPESIAAVPQLMYYAEKCAHCDSCAAACLSGAHKLAGGAHTLAREKCKTCGDCARVCSTGALRLVGQSITAAEVVAQAKRDMRYYRTSGGGLTITGGEPMCQLAFTAAIAKLACGEGIGVALETNGAAPFDDYAKLLPFIDLFLLDYKLTDSAAHLAHTGVTNQATLRNIANLDSAGAKIVLRCPIIPGVNDDTQHFAAIAALTKKHSGILGFEIMPYHRLGLAKANALGLAVRGFAQQSETVKEAWGRAVIAYGGRKWRHGV